MTFDGVERGLKTQDYEGLFLVTSPAKFDPYHNPPSIVGPEPKLRDKERTETRSNGLETLRVKGVNVLTLGVSPELSKTLLIHFLTDI